MGSRNINPDVVVIPGASAGVGHATALAFAPRGARIGILARGPDGLGFSLNGLLGLQTVVAIDSVKVA